MARPGSSPEHRLPVNRRSNFGNQSATKLCETCANRSALERQEGCVDNVHTASDWVVVVPDWLGLLMFSGVPSICQGWNAVRVPSRAPITPRQRGSCFNLWTLSLRGSL
jgi:hypothetical protein